MTVIVVGAGIAGLACARALADAGVPVRVLERARVPGGRLASRCFAGRPVDLGAAYFTVSDPTFAALVRRWQAAGLAREWTDTLRVHDRGGRHPSTGPVRWAAPGGLRSLATDLADGLAVTVQHPVTRVEPGPLVDGEPATAVVLAMPGPQATRLLHPDLAAARDAAAGQRWSPALAVVLGFAHRAWEDFAAAFVNDHPVLARLADDGDRRGDRAPVLVAHTTAEFAAGHLAEPAAAGPAVHDAVRDLLALPEPADLVHVHRWTFAQPEPGTADFHLDPDGIGLAGDAFGPPRVQTAWSSGHRLAAALIARLAPDGRAAGSPEAHR